MVKIISLLIFKLNFLNPLISLLFYTPLTGLKVVNALNRLAVYCLQPFTLHICISWSLFNPFTAFTPHLLLPSLLDHLCHPHYKSPITSLGTHYLVPRIRDSFRLSYFCYYSMYLVCQMTSRHSHCPSVFHFWLKTRCSTNPYHHRLLMSHQDSFYRPGLRTDLLCWSVFIFVFDFFITVLCSRLS